MRPKFQWLLAGLLMVMPALVQASTRTPATPADLQKEVRHQLLMLPYYNVFDNLSFQVQGNQITLSGQVTRPVLRDDAANVVRSIPGVEVINHIEVLPLSPFDDRIRLAELRAIYGTPSLQRYGWGVNPSIRIVVRNGQVTLEGVVDSEADRNLANIRANGVSGVFSVVNNLRVATS